MTRRRFNFSITQLLLLTAFVALLAGMFATSQRVSEFGRLKNLVFSPDGRYLAAHYDWGGFRAWDLKQRRPSSRRLSLGRDGRYYRPDAMRFLTPTTLVVSPYDSDIHPMLRVVQWDVVQDRMVKESELSPLDSQTMIVSRQGQRAVVVSYDRAQGALVLWDVDKALPSTTVDKSRGASELAIAPDANRLAAVVRQETISWILVRVWDLETEADIRTFGYKNPVFNIALSDDGRRLAVQQCSAAAKTQVWNLDSGKLEAEMIEPLGSPLTEYQFSPDGSLLAGVEDDETIKIWDASSGQTKARLDLSENGSFYPGRTVFAFSPDGQALAVGNDDAIVLWDVDTQRRRVLTQRWRVATTIMFILGLIVWAVIWGLVARRRKMSTKRSTPQPASADSDGDIATLVPENAAKASTPATSGQPESGKPERWPPSLWNALILIAVAGVVAVAWSVASILLFTRGFPVEATYVAFRSYGAVVGVFALTRVVAGDLRRVKTAALLLLPCLFCCDCFTAFLAGVAFFAVREEASRKFIAAHSERDASLRSQ